MNVYYKVPMEDKAILLYSEIVEKEAAEVGNTGFFICKTVYGVLNDFVLQPYERLTKKQAIDFIINNTHDI